MDLLSFGDTCVDGRQLELGRPEESYNTVLHTSMGHTQHVVCGIRKPVENAGPVHMLTP